ncbi:MAG: DNA repair protein RecN [Selenomonadaceae bacterium]|nr:DNA repair protein RecN [Selenomonadaceae bacterium]
MLKSLTVENFALLENVTVEFGDGLNILTGETGAGKSILIDALGAAVGNRITSSQIRKGTDFLRVTATFSSGGKNFVVERKISRTGKNSITLDGTAITLARLKKFGAEILDVHGQNQNLELLRDEKIYALIDDEKILSELENFSELYRALTSKNRALDKKLSARAENIQRLEFLRWQAKEISSAHLKPNEDEKIDAEIRKLAHAEKIAENVQKSVQLLSDGDRDILTALARVMKNLSDAARFDNKLDSARQLLEQAEIFLREATDEIRDYGEAVDFSPERLDELHARADVIFKLKQKYGASVNEILSRLSNIREEIAGVENFDSDVAELQQKISELERAAKISAEKLLQLRRTSAKILSTVVEQKIRKLGMERAQFEIVVNPSEKLSSRGGDTADVLFCANVGEEKFSLSKVVSGGELSRIALALKAVAADDSASTLVFDEIDTGIGGVTAKTVAECISEISRRRQVLCITHLAQIASLADIHLRITKSEVNGRTVTKVKRLDETERVAEISRMASGKESTASIKNAREMLTSAKIFKRQLLA